MGKKSRKNKKRNKQEHNVTRVIAQRTHVPDETEPEQGVEMTEALQEEQEPVIDLVEVTPESESGASKRKYMLSDRMYNAVRFVCLGLAAGALIYASYHLTISYLNYKEDEKKYSNIENMFVQDVEVKQVDKNGKISYSTEKQWVWDYDAMLEYNDEAKGYIKLDGTRIQYPIVEHSDNTFYLWRGVDKVKNGSGSIFIDYRTAGLDGKMCILYGHNMLDGSMFQDIMDFRNKEFCKKHQVFDVYIGYKHYLYYVFSTFSAKDTDENVYEFGFESDSDFKEWIDRVASKSSYSFGYGKPGISDKVIMCSTCVDDYGNRQLVCMYRGEEVAD